MYPQLEHVSHTHWSLSALATCIAHNAATTHHETLMPVHGVGV